MAITPLTSGFVLFSAWPVAIGTVSHLHTVQAQMSVQAANVVHPCSGLSPGRYICLMAIFRRGDTRDPYIGNFLHRAQFKAWCYTLERLGPHAQARL